MLPYNQKSLAKAQGLVNLGATCYLNSFLQCLMSCTSIYDQLHIVDREHDFYKMQKAALEGRNIHDMPTEIWKKIISYSQGLKNKVKMDNGQQDSHEGLMMLLDMFPQQVQNLFSHRYQFTIICECGYKSSKKEENVIFEIQPDLKIPQLEEFKNVDINYGKDLNLLDYILNQNSYVENYTCEKCKSKKPKFRKVSLTMVPEIITVLIKKYNNKVKTMFPDKLEIPNIDNTKKLIYHLVAQSEHSGCMSGGHYWAICKRADGWKMLNDGSVSDAVCGPTENTYLVFYHYIGIVKN